jgi:hypothetical protein
MKMDDSKAKHQTDDIKRFYELLNRLEARVGGRRTLSACHGRMKWPPRGVYFFFEDGEDRSGSGVGPRVVRVGTGSLITGGKSTLWIRLRNHRGTAGGGNHRGSKFRLLLGDAIKRDRRLQGVDSWSVENDIPKAAHRLGITEEQIKAAEGPLEGQVSEYIGAMPFLWVSVNDEAGPKSDRGIIERNSIALMSNHCQPFDPPSGNWLGANSKDNHVRASGLWNSDHVFESYDPVFLVLLEQYVESAGPV